MSNTATDSLSGVGPSSTGAGYTVGKLPSAGSLPSYANNTTNPGLFYLQNNPLNTWGPTAGYGINGNGTKNPINRNPPYYGVNSNGVGSPYGGNPSWAPNRVGVAQTLNADANGNFYQMFFLYNPNEVDVDFSFNSQLYPPSYTADGSGSISASWTAGQNQSSSVYNALQGSTISWTLFFDRTYDMMYSGQNPENNRGVLKDVAALYNLMGAFTDNGIPQQTEIQVIFAQTEDGAVWGYNGYFTSVSVKYGIFRHNMIPSRCEVDITLTTTYTAPSVPSSAPSTPITTFGLPLINPIVPDSTLSAKSSSASSKSAPPTFLPNIPTPFK